MADHDRDSESTWGFERPPPTGPQSAPPGAQQPRRQADADGQHRAHSAAAALRGRFGLGMLVGIIAGIPLTLMGVFAVGIAVEARAPADLGDSGRADALHRMCSDGNMPACDLLYVESATGSLLEEFAATCGGRTRSLSAGQCSERPPEQDGSGP